MLPYLAHALVDDWRKSSQEEEPRLLPATFGKDWRLRFSSMHCCIQIFEVAWVGEGERQVNNVIAPKKLIFRITTLDKDTSLLGLSALGTTWALHQGKWIRGKIEEDTIEWETPLRSSSWTSSIFSTWTPTASTSRSDGMAIHTLCTEDVPQLTERAGELSFIAKELVTKEQRKRKSTSCTEAVACPKKTWKR